MTKTAQTNKQTAVLMFEQATRERLMHAYIYPTHLWPPALSSFSLIKLLLHLLSLLSLSFTILFLIILNIILLYFLKGEGKREKGLWLTVERLLGLRIDER